MINPEPLLDGELAVGDQISCDYRSFAGSDLLASTGVIHGRILSVEAGGVKVSVKSHFDAGGNGLKMDESELLEKRLVVPQKCVFSVSQTNRGLLKAVQGRVYTPTQSQ